MQCEALTTKDRRCQRQAAAYHPHQGRDVLICPAHHRSDHQGTLRVREVPDHD